MKDKLYTLFNLSEENHWWFLARRRIVLALLKKYLPGGARPRILDVGCGAGETLKQLEELGNPMGVDISPEAVRYCRERGCGEVRLVEGIELPAPDCEFDLVLSLDVIEHLEDDLEALREYRRVIKPGGVLLITVPAYRWLWSGHDDDNLHLRRYTRRMLSLRLTEAGLAIERVTYFCTYLFPLVMSIRLLEKTAHRMFNWRKEGIDFKIPGLLVNNICRNVFSWESRHLVRKDFPFGSSLLAVCRKEIE